MRIRDMKLSGTSGVVLLQYAFVMPMFLLAALASIDWGHVMIIKSVTSAGAQRSLERAQKIEFLGFTADELDPASNEGQALQKSRDKVLSEAVDFITQLWVDDCNGSGNARLICGYNIKSSTNKTPINSPKGAILLRPGETAEYTDGFILQHPTIRSVNNKIKQYHVMKIHPLIVEVRVLVERHFPFLDPIVVVGRAVGFRQNYPPPEVAPVVNGNPAPVPPTRPKKPDYPSGEPPDPPPWPCTPNWDACEDSGDCPTSNPLPSGICQCGPCQHTNM